MIIAPAMGIAALQVLGWLCAVVAGLLVLLMAKQFVAPNLGFQMGAAALSAMVFGGLSLASFWAGKKVLKAARGE